MPKKIENAKELLLERAKELLEREGYERLTMRSVANAAGLGVGTAYNYFPSKNILIASFMLEDWQACLGKMTACGLVGVERVGYIYACLQEFVAAHARLFSDASARTSYASAAADFHKPLRAQVAGTLAPVCGGDAFLAEFIAESLLRWLVEDTPFDVLRPILEKIIKI